MVSTYQKEGGQLGWEEEVGSCMFMMFLFLGGRGAFFMRRKYLTCSQQ